MCTWPKKLLILVVALLMGVTAILSGTFAWDTEQQALNNMQGEDATTKVTLQKLEKTVDGKITATVIPGTEFKLYKEDGTLIGGPYVTDSKGQITVMLSPGDYCFEETAPTLGFTYDCDASGNPIREYCFTVIENMASVTVTAYNRPSNDETVEIAGEKTWDLNGWNISLPRSIKVYLMNGNTVVDTQTVCPDASGDWTYRFIAPKYQADGVEIKYTVQEEPVEGYYTTYSGNNIKNTYIAPIEVELPEITKVVEGKDASKEKFTFVIQCEGNAPMPDGEFGDSWKVTRTGKGTVSLGRITFTEPGNYVYTVYEVNDGDYNWEYDSAEYTIIVHIRQNESKLTNDITIEKDGKSASKITFTNIYEKVDLTKKVTISGQKTWYHKDNPEENWPDHIVVKIYADGVLIQQQRVTKETDWKYEFEFPKYNSSGKEIEYQVDEAEVEDYSKKVRGYDLFNTYVGTPDDPEPTPSVDPTPTPTDPSDPEPTPSKPDRPAKTGEEFDLSYWGAMVIFSLCGLILMILLWIMNPPYKGKRVKKKGRRSPPPKRG